MSCYSMTEVAPKLVWTLPGNISSVPKLGLLKLYHQREQHCCNIQGMLYTKVGMFGGRHLSVLRNSLLQRPVDGARVPHKDGNHCGHYYQKQLYPVLNCYDVDARKDVWGSASVSRLLCNVHHYVIVVATAITMTQTKCCPDNTGIDSLLCKINVLKP